MDVKSILFSLVLATAAAPAMAARFAPGQCPSDHGSPLGATLARRTTCPLLVDDRTASRTGQWGPWTEEPHCVYPDLQDDEGDDVKFCSYTFGTYNLGEGITLLTTPEAASSAASRLWDVEPAWRARRHLRQKVSPKPTKGIKYRLKEIPGKGIGLIATRRIRRKEVFLTDLPSLFIDSRLETLADQAVADFEEDRKALYNFGVESLGGKDRVLALSGSRSSFEGIDNIFKSNSFLVATDEGNHNGLFPEVARINHDCEPNATARFSTTQLTMEAMALRDIQPGEEITFSYIAWGLPTDHRAFLTAQIFGFKCQCALCSLPYEESLPRDGRLRRMQEIEGLLKSGDQSYEAASDMARELIRLATEEKLEGKMQEIYLDLMGVFYDFADYANALYFAETALGYAEEFEEPEGATITGIRTNINVLRGLVAEG